MEAVCRWKSLLALWALVRATRLLWVACGLKVLLARLHGSTLTDGSANSGDWVGAKSSLSPPRHSSILSSVLNSTSAQLDTRGLINYSIPSRRKSRPSSSPIETVHPANTIQSPPAPLHQHRSLSSSSLPSRSHPSISTTS